MNAKDLVEDLLREYPEARDSDKKLFFYYLRDCLGWPLKEYHMDQLLDQAYSIETLRRSRQIIQNEEGKLQASEEVQDFREEREQKLSADISSIWKDSRKMEGEA